MLQRQGSIFTRNNTNACHYTQPAESEWAPGSNPIRSRPEETAIAACCCDGCRLGEPPELTPHPEWLRQSELFAVLKGLSFFKQWRVRTVRAGFCAIGCSSFLSNYGHNTCMTSTLRDYSRVSLSHQAVLADTAGHETAVSTACLK
jgi:hypothetical protein